MSEVVSRDGTRIGYDRHGSGPPVVLVDGATGYRAFNVDGPIADQLESQFTVYVYDRRGRGESGDTAPYAVEREIDDLAALIDEAGGSACVYGVSSGAALVLEAAAAGLPITKMALYEPVYTSEVAGPQPAEDYGRRLHEHLAAGRRGDAAEEFMRYAGADDAMVAGARASSVWPLMEGIAPTLAYDHACLNGAFVPRERAAKVTAPALVMAGGDSPELLRRPAEVVAGAMPNAEHRVLDGQTHMVAPEVIGAALREFFA